MTFAKLAISLQLAVTMSVSALGKLRMFEILQTYRPQFERWPGLIVDVMEEQVIADPARISEIAKELKQLEVKLAIDNFGRRYTALPNLKELPLARSRSTAASLPIAPPARSKDRMQTIIDLATTVAVSPSRSALKASDAIALLRMGCDCGQGFLLGQPMPESLFMSLLRQRTNGQQQPGEAGRSQELIAV